MKKTLVFLFLLLFMNACAGKWYHPVKGEAQFGADQAECESTGRNAGLASSHYGRRVEQNAYQRALSDCLYRKGWSSKPVPVEVEKKVISSPLSTRLSETTFLFGEKQIILPEGARLIRQSISSIGSLAIETLEIEGIDNGVSFSGRIILQQSFGPEEFQSIQYPVLDPFFIYAVPDKTDGLYWRSFVGKLDGSWYGGMGAYLYISKKFRVILILTTPLPPKEKPYPSTARISFSQADAMDRFQELASPWFEKMASGKKWSRYFKSKNLRLEFGD